MRTTSRVLLPLLLLLSLVIPGTAHAQEPTPLPQAEWEAQLNAAMDGSTIFLPGVTLHFATGTKEDGQSLDVTVLTDGSLEGQRPAGVGTERIRCVRVDRCWVQSEVLFGDVKWHRTPVGTVTYVSARTYWWSTVIGQDWPPEAVYLTGAADDATVLYMVGEGNELAFTMVGTYVHSTEIGTLTILLINNEPVANRGTVALWEPSAPTVLAPRRAQVGSPATSAHPWTVPINPPASAAAPPS